MKAKPFLDVLALSLLTVLVLTVFWAMLLSQWQANQNYDYVCCYEPVARNWMDGKGWVFDNGNFGGSYPPGYSLSIVAVKLLAGVIGNEVLAMKVLIAFCTVATVVILYFLGCAVGGLWLGRAAAVSALGYPFFLWLAKQPNSETPFIPLLAMSVYGYVRMIQSDARSNSLWRWAAVCGVSSGLASLVRPISVFSGVVLALCAWYVLRHSIGLVRRTAMVAIVVLANVAVVLPWELKLHSEKGGWPLLADNDGVSFLQGMTFGLDKPDLKATPVSADVHQLMERADAREGEIRKVGGLLRFLVSEAVSNPIAFSKLMWLKITRVWFATHSTEGMQTSTILIEGLFMTLAVFGLWILRRRAPGAVLGLVVFTLYFWAMAALVVPLLRYMVPVTVVLTVGVGAAMVWAAERAGWLASSSPSELS